MRLRIFFAWYDLWVGAYWDRDKRALYVCPIPTVVIRLDLVRRSYKLCCYGTVFWQSDTRRNAFRIAEEHIRKCPKGVMVWADTAVQWEPKMDNGLGVPCWGAAAHSE